MIKITYGFLLIFLLHGMVACKDDLPKPTTSGANTFGCKINGKSWVPEGGTLSNIEPIVARYQNNVLRIAAKTANQKDNINIYIYIKDITDVGEYPINFNTASPPWGPQNTSYGIYDHIDKTYLDPITKSYGKYTFYATNANHPGKVKITRFDKNAKIVSGSFEFTAEELNTPGQLVTLSKGRFDLHWD